MLPEEQKAHLEKLLHEKLISEERLTRDQLAEAFRLALYCGDFMRHVVVSHDAQFIDYQPFREVERLKRRILDLEAELEACIAALGFADTSTDTGRMMWQSREMAKNILYAEKPL